MPVSAAAIERAIELNQVAVAANKAAFAWGRRAAVDLEAVERAAAPAVPVRLVPTARPAPRSLDETVAIRRDFLVGYQNRRYAARYVARFAVDLQLHEFARMAASQSFHTGSKPRVRNTAATSAGER